MKTDLHQSAEYEAHAGKLETTTRELENIRHALDKSAIVAITDVKGTITHVNDKFCEISKYSREELLGQNHRIINSGYHSKEFFADLWKTIARGKVWEGEIKNRAKDGTFYWVYTTIVPFLNAKGQPYQYVAIRYEITQRKLAEEKVIAFAEQLKASNEELQSFATIAAHDLQEPLRKIQSFSDRLQVKGKEQLTPELLDYIDRIQVSSKRMPSLIDDLLSYSRVSTQAAPFELVRLDEVVKGVLSDLEVRIEQTRAKINVEKLPEIEADSSQLRQLFQNLLSNALKFHKEDVTPEIDISARTMGIWCTIEFKDNGIGFDEQYLDRIFTIFQRLHGRHEYEGTGVGLAVCRKIVERHGGTLTARGTPGQGAIFVVTLPVRQFRNH